MIGTYINDDGVQHDIALWKLEGYNGDVFFAGTVGNSEENRKKYGKNKEVPKEEEVKPKSDIDELPF